MLGLTRKCSEQIVTREHDIAVTVLEVCGTGMCVGVEAPTGAFIHRQEEWQRIQRLLEPFGQPDPQCSS